MPWTPPKRRGREEWGHTPGPRVYDEAEEGEWWAVKLAILQITRIGDGNIDIF
jgi:hypothetical protein